jgi:hypothetical protein
MNGSGVKDWVSMRTNEVGREVLTYDMEATLHAR